MRRIPFLTLALLAASPAISDPAFAPRSTQITHEYTGGWEHFVGGGLASFDCNGDHLPELFAAGGSTPAALLMNVTPSPGAEVAFEEATPDVLALTAVTGAYPLDLDNDGITDLTILRAGENLLLRGLGNCDFEALPASFGFTDNDRWTTAFTATWEAGNALPTLAFGNYVDRDNPQGPFEACDVNYLYRPDGDHWSEPTALTPGFCPLSALFSDWSRSGRADLRLSNDRHYYVKGGQEQMWAMDTEPRLYGPDDGWKSFMIWGMGIASRDLTGDGLPEVYLSSMGDQKLQLRDTDTPGPSYSEAKFDRGITAHRPYTGDEGRPSTGWHVAFGDIQNDGRDDIFVAKGNVEQMPSAAMKDPNNLLIQQPDGNFTEKGDVAGIATTERSRGAVLEDFNLDGLLDLAINNRRAPVEIYQNVTENTGNWLQLAVSQPAPNTAAIGTWVELETNGTTYARELTVGGGHAGGSNGFQHFGLGEAGNARVRAIWPGGITSDWHELAANDTYLLSRDGNDISVSALD